MQNTTAKLLKRSSDDVKVDPSILRSLLRAYRPEEPETANFLLTKFGIFLKIEGVGSDDNTRLHIRYQFDWLSRFRKVIPDNLPSALILFEISGRAAYAVQNISCKTMHHYLLSDFIGMPCRSGNPLVQLERVLTRLRMANGEHNDLNFENILIEDKTGRVMLIDPAMPRTVTTPSDQICFDRLKRLFESETLREMYFRSFCPAAIAPKEQPKPVPIINFVRRYSRL